MLLAEGDATSFLKHPISAALLLCAAALLAISALPGINRRREIVFKEST